MRKNGGFTLVELIVILVVIGILAVFLLPNMRTMSAFKERGDYDRVVSALQYARKAAIAQRRYVCVSRCQPDPDDRPESPRVDGDAVRRNLPVR
jgi:prepilin-type N-terminal cleavage/methylation domain-containing protein